MAYKTDGEGFSDDDYTKGILLPTMMEFRERSGYRSVGQEDTLTDESNTDSENTDTLWLVVSYRVSASWKDLFDDQSIDPSLWTINQDIGDADLTLEENEDGFLYMRINQKDDENVNSSQYIKCDVDIWSSEGVDSVYLSNVSILQHDSDTRVRTSIEVEDSSGTNVELWKEYESDAGNSQYDYDEMEFKYLSSSDEIEVYLDGSLHGTKDISSLNSGEKYFKIYQDDSNAYNESANGWAEFDAIYIEKYVTGTTYTYQTSSLESTDNNISAGILLYDEDQTQIPANTTLTAYASSNGGTNWTQVTNNTFGIPDGEQGTDLRFKFELETSDSSVAPKINKWKYLYFTGMNP